MIIKGNTVGTPTPRSDLTQTNPKHAAYVHGKDKFLEEGVNAALAKAKASGEFDGKDGKDGLDGKDGYTPVKGKDYFDGKDGKDGNDGYTPRKGVDYFDGRDGQDGYTPRKNIDYFDGKDGQPGADGRTPEKGVDYFTVADKQEMVAAVIAALPVYNGEVVDV